MTSNTQQTVTNGPEKLLWDDPDFAARYKAGESITGVFAHDLLNQMSLASYPDPINFLDLACGTGIVTKQAIEILTSPDSKSTAISEHKFTCADLAPEMLKVLKSRVSTEKWPVQEGEGMQLIVANMTDTKLESDVYTHLGCNFGPCMAPEPDKTLAECYRVLKPGGVAGWTAWRSSGWEPDMRRALDDIKRVAKEKCERGQGSEEDRKLAMIPAMSKFEDMIAKFAGLDLPKMRAKGLSEAEIPRWDQEDWFQSRVEKAGFTEVKLTVRHTTLSVEKDDVSQMIMPLAGILKTLWTEEQKKSVGDVDLQAPLRGWFQHRFEEKDVKDGKLVWDNWRAMLITGRKAA